MDDSPVVDFKDGPQVLRPFTVESQSLFFDLDFQNQKVVGRTEIRVQPHSRETRTFQLNCRQCTITRATVDGKPVNFTYDDSYLNLQPNPSFSVHHHHFLKSKVEALLACTAPAELTIPLPPKFQIKESEQYKALRREDPLGQPSDATNIAGRYASIIIAIEFETTGLRDGLQWVGCIPGDGRWPHVYTKNSPLPGPASCLFPCVDDIHARNPWTISINTPRTLGDAFRRKRASEPSAGTGDLPLTNGNPPPDAEDIPMLDAPEEVDEMEMTEADKELELIVVTSGELTGDTIDPNNGDRKIQTFAIPSTVSANQVGFAVGPFEDVDLSEFREVHDDEKLGEAAIRVHGFCLPGRAEEVRNACMPMAKAIDFFTTTFTTYTGESFKLCFVDDLSEDTTDTAGLAICSTRLLFPTEIVDLLAPVTRALVFALASQWSGVHVVPREAADSWAVAGIAVFMTDAFLKSLMGRNEYRFQQKVNADKIYEQDLNRPSLYDLGRHLDIDPDERRFMTLKAGVVFFILDQRFLKANGTSGMGRVVGRILGNAKSDEMESSFLSTEKFIHQCSRSGHQKLDTFFHQWVYCSGCPKFQVLQEMNKKKLQVLMTFTQTHMERIETPRDLEPANFIRESKEEAKGVWAGDVPPAFVGPMTISIHEADGTPYEHTVEITSQHWVTHIPYNTKYKRMRRGRRLRDRNRNDDPQEEVLLYSLGDVLQGEDDIVQWRLSDWDAEMEQKMGEESYEWIRMDADFEWICSMSIKMPAYMWMSQLQQDKDVVAQMESLQWVSYETTKAPHPLISTYLLRTLLDKRYFHGIRTMAAERLPNCAKVEVNWIGLYHLQKAFQEMFCVSSDSPMPRPNDFSQRDVYLVQHAMLQGLADIRDNNGRAPAQVKKFFMDTLKFNDNSTNDYSDTFYVSRLLSCLTKTLLGPRPSEDQDDEQSADDYILQRDAIAEIQRYKRINEWTPSFQNVFTMTALDCLVKLGKAGVVKPNFKEFLRYTLPEHSDQVRIKAFECLVDLEMYKKESVMTYLVHELSTDPSPYVRENLFRIFGRVIGKIAIGEKDDKSKPAANRGLVIEEESLNLATDTQAILKRRQTVEGAVSALKKELEGNERLKEAIWSAVRSPILSLREVANLLHICSISYEEGDGLPLTFKLPRYWTFARTKERDQMAGEDKQCWVVFRKNGSYRTKPKGPMPDLLLPPELRAKRPEPAPALVPLSVKSAAASRPAPPAAPVRKPSQVAPPPRKPSLPIPSPTPGPVHLTTSASTPKPEPKRLLIKLKTGSFTPITRTPTAASMQAPPFTTPTAPYGFGTITSSSPVAVTSPQGSTASGAMSPPPRPSSSKSESAPAFGPIDNITAPSADATGTPFGFGAVSNATPARAATGTRKRKSETPVPREETSAKRRRSATPRVEAAEAAAEGKVHVKAETPVEELPKEPPKRTVLKIKLGGLGALRGPGGSAGAPPSR